ncbi:MAG: YqjK family protein [Proteobacteria bacterium]|nr:YqjK family protein [Pseudomonadota bacterium]
MNSRLIEIGVRRGRLLERIAAQRAELAGGLRPFGAALRTTDRMLASVRAGGDYVRAHPATFATLLAGLALLRPRRVWRWSKRGFFAWRVWRAVRTQLATFAARTRA